MGQANRDGAGNERAGAPGAGNRKSDRRGAGRSSTEDADSERSSEEETDKEALDSQLDEELEDSFPASDPPSLTQDPR